MNIYRNLQKRKAESPLSIQKLFSYQGIEIKIMRCILHASCWQESRERNIFTYRQKEDEWAEPFCALSTLDRIFMVSKLETCPYPMIFQFYLQHLSPTSERNVQSDLHKRKLIECLWQHCWQTQKMGSNLNVRRQENG